MLDVVDLSDSHDVTALFVPLAGTWTLTFEEVPSGSTSGEYALQISGSAARADGRYHARYFPRTAAEDGVTLESPFQPGAVHAAFSFDGTSRDVLLLEFHSGLSTFGFDFYRQGGFILRLARR